MAFQERSNGACNPTNIDPNAIIPTWIVYLHVVAALINHRMYLGMYLVMKSIVFCARPDFHTVTSSAPTRS